MKLRCYLESAPNSLISQSGHKVLTQELSNLAKPHHLNIKQPMSTRGRGSNLQPWHSFVPGLPGGTGMVTLFRGCVTEIKEFRGEDTFGVSEGESTIIQFLLVPTPQFSSPPLTSGLPELA